MRRKNVLLICGSLNQTTMMHRIGEQLSGRHDCFFSPFYADGLPGRLKPLGLLDHTIIAGRFRETTERYLASERLPVDDGGGGRHYDLVVTDSPSGRNTTSTSISISSAASCLSRTASRQRASSLRVVLSSSTPETEALCS